MKKRMYKYENGTTVKRNPLITSENVSSTREVQTETIQKRDVKKQLLPALVLLGLGGLIGMSIVNNNLLLDQILICSVIISLVLFIKVRGENTNTNNRS